MKRKSKARMTRRREGTAPASPADRTVANGDPAGDSGGAARLKGVAGPACRLAAHTLAERGVRQADTTVNADQAIPN
jgi:hypothetical protein